MFMRRESYHHISWSLIVVVIYLSWFWQIFIKACLEWKEFFVVSLTSNVSSQDWDGMFGDDVILGIDSSFPFISDVHHKVFSSIWFFSSICFSSHSVVFRHGLMWRCILHKFCVESSILYQYESGSEACSRIMAGFHVLSMVLNHHTIWPDSYVEMESSSEMSINCFLIIALWYSLLDKLPCGIDGKFVHGLCPVSISNGEGMFAVSEVHLYSIRPKFQGLFCRIEQFISFFTIFTIASAKLLDWGKWGELVICCICKASSILWILFLCSMVRYHF